MSSAAEALQTPETRSSSWGLWLRQIRAIVSLELEKNFLSRRSILIYLIAILPLLPALIFAFVPLNPNDVNFNDLSKIYALLYHSLILRTVVFFGCAWILDRKSTRLNSSHSQISYAVFCLKKKKKKPRKTARWRRQASTTRPPSPPSSQTRQRTRSPPCAFTSCHRDEDRTTQRILSCTSSR